MSEGANPYVWAITVDVVTGFVARFVAGFVAGVAGVAGFVAVFDTVASAFAAVTGEKPVIDPVGGIAEIDISRSFPILGLFAEEGARLVPLSGCFYVIGKGTSRA
jgi:hypothetical protein